MPLELQTGLQRNEDLDQISWTGLNLQVSHLKQIFPVCPLLMHKYHVKTFKATERL